MRNGKFVIKRGRGGKTHFVLLASNGRVVATSETYESKESCLKGIAAVKPRSSPTNATRPLRHRRARHGGGRVIGAGLAAAPSMGAAAVDLARSLKDDRLLAEVLVTPAMPMSRHVDTAASAIAADEARLLHAQASRWDAAAADTVEDGAPGALTVDGLAGAVSLLDRRGVATWRSSMSAPPRSACGTSATRTRDRGANGREVEVLRPFVGDEWALEAAGVVLTTTAWSARPNATATQLVPHARRSGRPRAELAMMKADHVAILSRHVVVERRRPERHESPRSALRRFCTTTDYREFADPLRVRCWRDHVDDADLATTLHEAAGHAVAMRDAVAGGDGRVHPGDQALILVDVLNRTGTHGSRRLRPGPAALRAATVQRHRCSPRHRPGDRCSRRGGSHCSVTTGRWPVSPCPPTPDPSPARPDDTDQRSDSVRRSPESSVTRCDDCGTRCQLDVRRVTCTGRVVARRSRRASVRQPARRRVGRMSSRWAPSRWEVVVSDESPGSVREVKGRRVVGFDTGCRCGSVHRRAGTARSGTSGRSASSSCSTTSSTSCSSVATTHHLAVHVDGASVAEFAVVFGLIWLAWFNGTFWHELHGREDGRSRNYIFLQMGLLALLAVFAGEATSGDGQAFAITYAVLFALLTWQWYQVQRIDDRRPLPADDHPLHRRDGRQHGRDAGQRLRRRHAAGRAVGAWSSSAG